MGRLRAFYAFDGRSVPALWVWVELWILARRDSACRGSAVATAFEQAQDKGGTAGIKQWLVR